MSLNISDCSLLKTATLPPEKSRSLFPSNPPVKNEILSSPAFLKTWPEAQPPPPPPSSCRKGGGDAHYESDLCSSNQVISLDSALKKDQNYYLQMF